MSEFKHKLHQLFLSVMDPDAISYSGPKVSRDVYHERRNVWDRDKPFRDQLCYHAFKHFVRPFLQNRGIKEVKTVNEEYLNGFELSPEQKYLYRMIEHKSAFLPSRAQHVPLVAMTAKQKEEAAKYAEKMGNDMTRRASLILQLAQLEERMGYQPPVELPDELEEDEE
jgi:hypothetical protein